MTEDIRRTNAVQFSEYFVERLKFVKINCTERIEATILLCTYLDSLAGYRYGGSSSATRFKRFLVQDTEQAETWNRVSLILLRQYLEEKNLDLYSELVHVLDRLGANTAKFNDLNHNPDITLASLVSECEQSMSSEEIATFRADMERFEYSGVLWNAYRNSSIHETSILIDRAMNLAEHKKPFYSNEKMIVNGEFASTFTRFDIPNSFLIATVESGLSNLKELVTNGTCSLQLSRPFNRPMSVESETTSTNVDVNVGYPRMITKPFRVLRSDIDELLDQAKISHDLFASTRDGSHRWREGAMARSCIVTSVFYLESLVNCVIGDFSRVKPHQLPDKILRKVGLGNRTLNRLPLIERLYLTPYLCCSREKIVVNDFFDKGSIQYQKVAELIKIRDSFAHSRPVQRKMTIKKTGEKTGVIDDQFKVNFFKSTGFPRDIFIIDWNHAKQASEIISWAMNQLDQFIGGKMSEGNWMSDERIELGPSNQ